LFFFGLSAFLGQDVHIVSIMKRQMDKDRFFSPRVFFHEALMHGCIHAQVMQKLFPPAGRYRGMLRITAML
jgi:hypothetical protein